MYDNREVLPSQMVSSLYSDKIDDTKTNAKAISRRWNVPLEMARKVIQSTTRLCKRNTNDISLNRRYSNNDRMLRYPRVKAVTFTDTLLTSKRCVSFRGFTCAQIFATEFGYIFASPMKKRQEMAKAVKLFFKTVGVPPKLVADKAREQILGDTKRLCQLSECQIIELEKGTPSANRAERYIQMIKNETKQDLIRSDSPLVFWCYALERRMKIINACPRDNFLLQGECPHTKMTGQPYDISNVCEFEWFEWIKYRHHGEQFPYPSEKLGRCLGPSNDAGNGMTQYVLTDKGTVITIQTLRSLTPAEMNSPTETKKREIYMGIITTKFGNSSQPPPNWNKNHKGRWDDNIDDAAAVEKAEAELAAHKISMVDIELWDDQTDGMIYDDTADDSRDDFFETEDDLVEEREELVDVDDIPDLDLYLTAEVLLPQNGEHMQAARVISRAKDAEGKVIGTYNNNPILDTRVYDVMFPDGAVQQYSANIIAENLYSQVDEEGHRYQLMEGIVMHRRDGSAVTKEEAYDSRGKMRLTTKGWDLCVAWKDGTSSWLPLKEIKNSFPIEVAEYAMMAGISDEPAFAWWVKSTLKKRDKIIASVRSRIKKKCFKYGIEVPGTVYEAYLLDIKNGNSFWRDAIAKEMRNVRVAFEVLPEGSSPPIGYKELECYMVFDVKMDLTRKARFVANGSKTDEPKGSKYAGVVSRESVRICFTYAALHGLNVLAGDIQNAYLTAPTSEKFWCKCGKEFGSEEEGRIAVIVRALYGTKSSGRDFRNHLRDCMDHMGFQSSLGDPDVWFRPAVKDDGTEYYEYMLLYVDDTLCCSEHPMEAMLELNKYFPFKKDKKGRPLIEPPSIYLGGKVSQVELPNGVTTWAISSSQYIQECVRNVEEKLKLEGKALKKGTCAPMAAGYHPECDVSPELNGEEANYYQSLIGELRWIVEMGRIDICCEVSMLSSYVALPREGHLQQVYHMMAYLKRFHNARLVMDPTYPDIEDDNFVERDWENFYGNLREEIPCNAPEPRGNEFVIRVYVDASHADNKVNRKSRTGFIVFLNSSPIYWYSKKQGGTEGSTFGSEFVAMKTACEYIKGLRYSLRMMGIPVQNPTFVYGDNKSVLWNVTVPDSMLKKKAHGIAYHFCRQGCAKKEWLAGYIKSEHNPSDILTKAVPAGENRKRKVKAVLYDIYE